MKKGQFTEEQIIGVPKEQEAGRKVQELAREIGVSAATIYTWKSKYGEMDVSDAQKLKGLGHENRHLKHLVADLSLDKEVLKAVIQKNGWAPSDLVTDKGMPLQIKVAPRPGTSRLARPDRLFVGVISKLNRRACQPITRDSLPSWAYTFALGRR
jgi:putative transposase